MKRDHKGSRKLALLFLYTKSYVESPLDKLERLSKMWWPHRRKTLTHNQQEIQRLIGKWERKQVKCGTSEEWNRAVQHWDMPEALQGTNLWIDSIDLQMKGRNVISKKSRKWSYKLDAPERRYLFIFDCRGRVQKWWGKLFTQEV